MALAGSAPGSAGSVAALVGECSSVAGECRDGRRSVWRRRRPAADTRRRWSVSAVPWYRSPVEPAQPAASAPDSPPPHQHPEAPISARGPGNRPAGATDHDANQQRMQREGGGEMGCHQLMVFYGGDSDCINPFH